jgi:4-hydroxy-tetrahydrodipicolinate synthase
MTADGRALNLEAVAPFIDFLVEKGIDGLFIAGTTSEGPLLSLDERRRLARAGVEAAHGRIPVVSQVGAITTQDAVCLARYAAEIGADAVACVAPYYYAYEETELEPYFLSVAEAVPGLPVYLYDIPSRTANPMSAALAQRLREAAPNIIGVKDSSGDMAHLLDYLTLEGFAVLSGSDVLAAAAVQAGAVGIVSGLAGVVPEPFVAMWGAWRRGDQKAFLNCYEVILRVAPILQHGAQFSLLKGIASRQASVDLGPARPPQAPVPAEQVAEVWGKLEPLLQGLEV